MNACISFSTIVLLQSLAYPLYAQFLTTETNVSAVLHRQKEIILELSNGPSGNLSPFIRSYIHHFHTLWNFDDEKIHKTLMHPLKIFRLLKHLTYDWDLLQKELRATGCVSQAHLEHIEVMRVMRHNVTFPVTEDLMSMGDGIGRLQSMYQLSTSDVANGVVKGAREPVLRLGAEECFLIGSALFRTEKYALAVEWMETAQERLWEENDITSDSDRSKITMVAQSVIQIARNRTLVNRTINPRVQLTIPHYEKLCRNDPLTSIVCKEPLRCYYETYGNPLLILQPLKMEILHESPKVILIHEFLLQDEAGHFIEMSRNNLKPPKSAYSGSNTTSGIKRRLSKSASLPRNISSIVDKIERWSAVASNLDSTHSEVLQVKNYGAAGALQLHFDLLQQRTRDFTVPDRMATLLIYLNDVETGGATIFPLLDLTIPIRKNTAVLWFNQYDDGESNGETLHAGCPVLLGEKWVAIKWYYDVGQDRQCPCGMSEDGREKMTIGQVRNMFNT